MRFTRFFQVIIAATLVASCGPFVKQADYIPSRLVPEDAAPAPIKFSGIELLLPPGMELGVQRTGSFCRLPHYPAGRSVLSQAIDSKFLKQDFHDALEANGYDVVDSLNLAFAPEDEIDRAEYSIKGKVVDVQMDTCTAGTRSYLLFDLPNPGTSGELYTAIDWTVWDALRRTVVFKMRTEGFARRDIPNQEGLSLLFHDAFVMAAHNLAADQDFYNLMVQGKKPPPNKTIFDKRAKKTETTRPRLFDPAEEVVLPPRPLSREDFRRGIEDKRKFAVKLEKYGHGSGFFISQQGHILTNSHVIGDAMRTRVVTSGKEHSIPAEVLRVDKARDVALLKLEEIPEGLDIVIPPIRLDWPQVGEDVYAIGAPISRRFLQDSVTKGIVSAHRKDMKFLGTRQNFIQADVTIHPGNSGGPLLDEHGNIIGLAVGAQVDGSGTGIELNYFIPIAEALDVLGIEVAGAADHQAKGQPLALDSSGK